MRPLEEAAARAVVVAEARTWIGTPYHSHAKIRGAGVDCGQLLLAVYAEARRIPETESGPYSPDWHLHHSDEKYLAWVNRWCVPTETPAPGDVALFRFGRCISHGGIVVDTEPVMLIHAYRGEGVRLEELTPTARLADRLVGYWTLRTWAAQFEHPAEDAA
jgi:NlpC/P60 family putative phage cell wall peptidase